MKQFLRTMLIVLAVVAVCSCRRRDEQVRVIHVPGMKNDQCGAIIVKALQDYGRLPNLEDAIVMGAVQFDYQNRTVTIRYDSMKTELKNLEHAIAQAGFQANEIPADAAAVEKLPAECR